MLTDEIAHTPAKLFCQLDGVAAGDELRVWMIGEEENRKQHTGHRTFS